MASITDSDVRAFLSSGTRTGKLGYIAGDGRPLVAPIWYLIEDDELVFTTGTDSAKGQAIARDPRLVLCVDLEEPPYGFVQVQGQATTSRDPDELVRIATAAARRYLGDEHAEQFGRRNGAPGELVVHLQPTRVIAVFDETGTA